ncbi:MAG: AAA+ family ATPase, partial [Acidobacteria bacterium]
LYLYRLKEPSVLLAAIRDSLGLLLWHQDSFAYADSYDEAAKRYRGLRCGQIVSLSEENLSGLLVKSEIARRQQEAESKVQGTPPGPKEGSATGAAPGVIGGDKAPGPGGKPVQAPAPKRYHGSVTLDPTRVGRDAGRIADEVIAHLAGLVGSKVKVTLEIEAEIPSGAPDKVVRTVTENGRTLKFTSQGIEED